MFWKRWITRQEVESMHSNIRHSFSKVRKDFSNVYGWLNHLYTENQELRSHLNHLSSISEQQKSEVRELNEELSSIPKSPEDIKRIIDSYYSYDSILSKINSLSQRIDSIAASRSASSTINMPQIQQTIQPPADKKASIREKLIKRLTKNSKEYVTKTIISYIKRYNSLSSTKLKEIIVEDQGLASKSSFYRIMEGIESLDDIEVARKGKERYYFYKQIAKYN